MNGNAVALPVLRRSPAILAGALCTLALLWAMQWLVRGDRLTITEPEPAPAIEFVRVIEDPPILEPEPPTRPAPTPPPPPLDLGRIEPKLGGDGVGVGRTRMPAPEAEGPVLTESGLAVPIVEAAPIYPRRCAARGIEGHVVVAFDIGLLGQPENVRVVEAEPEGCFERSAIAAVARFRYRPAMEGGEPRVLRGMRKRISYRLDE